MEVDAQNDPSNTLQENDSEQSGRAARKKPYSAPELVEWGSIADLTQGPFNQPGDFPAKGGTRHT